MPTLRRRSGPEIATAERLEFVRNQSHCDTLRDFWRELTTNSGYQVSYEAARNYHHDREPPVDYLVQVARTFDVELKWLATGEGNPWRNGDNGETEELAPEEGNGDRLQWEYERGIRDYLRRYDQLTPLASAVVLRTCDRLFRDAQLRSRMSGKSGPTRAYVGRFVGKAIAGPLVNAVAGTVQTRDLHPWQIETYVLGICGALTALIPNPNWSGVQLSDEMH
jgi:hypothetical protein